MDKYQFHEPVFLRVSCLTPLKVLSHRVWWLEWERHTTPTVGCCQSTLVEAGLNSNSPLLCLLQHLHCSENLRLSWPKHLTAVVFHPFQMFCSLGWAYHTLLMKTHCSKLTFIYTLALVNSLLLVIGLSSFCFCFTFVPCLSPCKFKIIMETNFNIIYLLI